jgi:hypothetical protein
MEPDVKHFLTYWIAGLLKGLESLDDTAQGAVLRECGKGCADSYTARIFTEAKSQSATSEQFLSTLARRFPDAVYELANPREIKVTYSHCACDLVQRDLTRSPIICQCSAYNLQANFERAFEKPVGVRLQSSILRGDPVCHFVVSLEDNIERSFEDD